VFVTAPTFGVEDISFTSGDFTAVELPEEITIPPPPAAVPRPAAPVITDAPVSTELTIPPTTLDATPVEALPPPPPRQEEETERNLAAAPTFTPMTVHPELLNPKEITEALLDYYPPVLRDAGVGGRVLVWFFIDEGGRVVRTLIHESSGYDAFDQAALKVADRMEFSPAYNRDQRVPVWVSIPIVFETI
jgi:protein TonB